MPELPEVEYARRRLQRTMAGARISRVVVRQAKLRYPFSEDFVGRLEGQTVRAVERRAKYLLVQLSSGDRLLMHLGMSGSFRIIRPGRIDPSRRRYYHDTSRPEAHDHVIFEMSTGANVVFNDPRRFGFMSLLTPDEHKTHKPLVRLGPEPLAPTFDAQALGRNLARRRTSLKMALSDQRVVGGLGNIYVVEALHRAGLSPTRAASTLVTRKGAPRAGVVRLVQAIREVLKEAIRRQYRPGDDTPFRVYDRKGERCLRRGCRGTIRRIIQGGRSTFYCPVCQR
jgi:formamidopyrimidine-DNA glycosylase